MLIVVLSLARSWRGLKDRADSHHCVVFPGFLSPSKKGLINGTRKGAVKKLVTGQRNKLKGCMDCLEETYAVDILE